MSTKLNAGQKYDIASLDFAGWSNGEQVYGGVSWQEWFGSDGEYRGADDEGVEPLFDLPVWLYYVAATGEDGQAQIADEVLGQYARTYFVDSEDAQAAVEELEQDSDEVVGPGIVYDVERIRFGERVESYRIVRPADTPAPYRWDGSALYRYDEATNLYVHCFASIYVTDIDEAIRLYEARKAAAEID